MARLPRLSPVDVPIHITQRGNNRQDIFVAEEDHVEGELLAEIRANANKGLALGNDRFKEEIEALTGR